MARAAGVAVQKKYNDAAIAAQHETNRYNLAMTRETNEANKAMTDATNKANIQIAQMGNEYNMKQLDKQIEQQWKMWNAENEYNSASAQAARMAEAGMNPWNAGVNAGTASSMTAPTPQGAITPTMEAPQFEAPQIQSPAEVLARAGNSMAEALTGLGEIPEMAASLLTAGTTGLANAASFADMLKFLKDNYKNQADKGKGEAKSALAKGAVDQATKEAEINRIKATSGVSMFQYLTSKEMFNVLPTQLQLGLVSQSVGIFTQVAQGHLTAQQGYREILNNKFLRDTLNTRIEREGYITEHARNNQGSDNWFQGAQDFFSGLTGTENFGSLGSTVRNTLGQAFKGLVGDWKKSGLFDSGLFYLSPAMGLVNLLLKNSKDRK